MIFLSSDGFSHLSFAEALPRVGSSSAERLRALARLCASEHVGVLSSQLRDIFWKLTVPRHPRKHETAHRQPHLLLVPPTNNAVSALTKQGALCFTRDLILPTSETFHLLCDRPWRLLRGSDTSEARRLPSHLVMLREQVMKQKPALRFDV